MACDIADLLKTIARGVHWRSKMSTDSFMLALAAAASPLLELQELYRNYAGTIQELCRNYAGTMPELYSNYAGTIQELCRNYAGTMQELCRNSAGTMQELYGN